MTNNQLRIRRQFEELADRVKIILSKPTSHIFVTLYNKNIKHWKGYIVGPEGTPYDGGIFRVDIKLPSQYPIRPPLMRIETKIWHPDFSSVNGTECLDITWNKWSPAFTIHSVLLTYYTLLCQPSQNDPQDGTVALEYKNDR